MAIELVPATPEHFDNLARICHLAFNALHERHGVPPDVPTEEVGRQMIGGILQRPDFASRVAVEDGRVVGSNFLLLADEVAGVGPVTVDPNGQSRGVGRLLMQWSIDEARRRRGERAQVRLFQEAINALSLSLYTKLGFQWRDTAASMMPRPADGDDPGCRPLTADDLPAVERLSARHYGFSRANDAAQLLKLDLPAFVRQRDGEVVAYQFTTLFGHAAGRTDDDLIALAAHTARHVPPPMSIVIVPLSQSALFRAALDAGFRVVKVLNYMTLEAYSPIPGPALPSILC